MVGNASAKSVVVKQGDTVSVVAAFGDRELSAPTSSDEADLSTVCGEHGAAVFKASAPGAATVTVSTAGPSGLSQLSFVAQVTVQSA